MLTSSAIERKPLSVLLFRRNASELLLETINHSLQLPVVSLPKHVRVAEFLTKAIKNDWNLDTVCLFPLSASESSDTSLPSYVVEVWSEASSPPAQMHWLPVTPLTSVEFSDPKDFAAIQASLIDLEQFRQGKRVGAFGKPGWLRTALEWVEPLAAGVGISLTGEFRQFNASPRFSLLRFETDGPALWFKAVGEPNVREFSITQSLTDLFPLFVPHVLGWHPDWNAWLSVEAEGMHLGEASPFENWTLVAAALAHLQIASCGHGLHLVEAGCKDTRVCSLLPLVDPFFERMAELMELQTTSTPARLSRAEIVLLADEVRCCLEELGRSEIPSVLGHLDFNPGNILVSPDRCVFLDWAEGCVSHPFLTFQYLLEWHNRICGRDAHVKRTLVIAYAALWRAFLPSVDIEKDCSLAPLLAAFAYAATSSTWKNTNTFESTTTTTHLCGLVRRMKREARALHEGVLSCPL